MMFVLLFLGLQFAKADGPDSNLQGQLTVTQNAIRQMVNDLERNASTQTFNVRDYRRWSPEFQKQVETALIDFENTLKIKILPLLQPVVDRMAMVQQSKGFTVQQKNDLQAGLVGQLNGMQEVLDRFYQNAIAELYEVIETIPQRIEYKVGGEDIFPFGRKHNYQKIRFPIHAVMKQKNGDSMATDLQFEYTYKYRYRSNYPFGYFAHDADCYEGSGYYSCNAMYRLNVVLGPQILPKEPACYMTASLKSGAVLTGSASVADVFEPGPIQCGVAPTKFLLRPRPYTIPLVNFNSTKRPLVWIAPQFQKSMPFKQVFAKIIARCQSQACVILQKSDLAFLALSIGKSLDKDLVFNLPVGGTFTIHKDVYSQTDHLRDVLERSDYPAEVEALPFDTD